MPFIRYSRDKRGNECTLVMHAYRPQQGPSRTRVLYLFRSPAHLKIGRRPLDSEVIEALEHTHPDLSFDWTELRKEPRPDPRPPRPLRRPKASARQASPPRPAEKPAPSEPIAPDDSLMGRVLGAAEARRLRASYATLLQRISRRARTPEDRARLLDRAERLNPEDWTDEAAVTAGAQSVEAAWDEVAAELPQRRRGRRGGRRRERADEPSGQGDRPAAAAGASGIMVGDEASGETREQDSAEPAVGDADRRADDGGNDRGAVGPGAGPADVPDGS